MPDGRRPTEPWKVDDDITADRLEMMRTLAEAAQLTAVGKNIRIYKNALGGTALAVDETPPAPSRQTLVKITGSASGGGKYTGTLWITPTSDITATGNLSEADLGLAGDIIRICNSAEVGLGTHDLSSSGYLPLIVPAVYLSTAVDGVAVYLVTVFQVKDCT